jgi:hypothetical protein
MSTRKVNVTATATFEFEIDDEAVSTWDGAKILEVIEKRKGQTPPVYTANATLHDILGGLGIALCVDGRTMGNFDGWADFPPETATGSPFSVDWDIEDVFLDNERLKP